MLFARLVSRSSQVCSGPTLWQTSSRTVRLAVAPAGCSMGRAIEQGVGSLSRVTSCAPFVERTRVFGLLGTVCVARRVAW
jgi:hypothetical protein